MLRLPTLLLLLGPAALAGDPPSAPSSLWWGDFDADGLDDAWVVQPDGPGRLLHNQDAGEFVDVTERAGLADVAGAHMAAWADADGDGRLDLYLPAFRGRSRLFLQGADGLFVEHTEASGLPAHAEAVDARWLDLDADGAADLWLTTVHDDLVFRNDGAARFAKVDLGLRPRPVPEAAARAATVDQAREALGLEPLGGAGAGGGGVYAPGPGAEPICALGVVDQANPGSCLTASSVPALGSLYPLSSELYVDAATGRVGINTTAPTQRLHVNGNARITGQLTLNTGSAPLVVSSTSRVDNLNADLLDGLDSGAFAQLPITSADVQNNSLTAADLATNSVGADELQTNSVGGAELQAGAISNVHVDNLAGIQGTKIIPNFGAQAIVTSTDVLAGGDFDAGYGAWNDPSFRFSPGEDTGLSSPSSNELHLLSNGLPMIRILPDGRINMGQDGGFLQVRAYAHTPIVPLVGTASAAIYGRNAAASGSARGVMGVSASNEYGQGVRGECSATDGIGYGVYGITFNDYGCGVHGQSNAVNGEGVQGECMEPGGTGVWAMGHTWGVRSRAPEPYGTAVWGWGLATADYSDGVKGETQHGSGYGVWGVNNAGGTAIAATGNFSATGTKAFVQPHPTEPEKVVRFVCLEGNEAGTYFRGSSALADGAVTIDVPEVFRMVTDPEDITVQVTPRGPAMVWVESVDLERIVVRGNGDVPFDYFVNGVRRGYQGLEPFDENRLYVPTERGVPYGEHLPAEVRQMLVDNGTLNADFTPNEATAARLGWTLRDPGWKDEQYAESEALRNAPQAELVPAPVSPGRAPGAGR